MMEGHLAVQRPKTMSNASAVLYNRIIKKTRTVSYATKDDSKSVRK